MSSELENPILKPSDPALDDIMKAAELADKGADIPANLLGKPADPGSTPATEPGVTGAEPDPEAEPAAAPAGERARDAQGRFIKTEKEIADEKAASEAAVASPATSESDYAKAQREKKEKETARLEKTWENVNRQKEEIEQRRRELEQRERQMSQPRQRPQVRREYSSKQVLEASQDFKARAKEALAAGDYDTFNEQNALSDKAFESAAQLYQIEQQEAQQTAQQRHQQTWQGHALEVFKSEPDAANPESPLSKQITQILEQHGNVLWMIPDGFKKAVELAKLRLEAADAPTLRADAAKWKAEVDRLNGLTSPSKDGVTSPPSTKRFEDMSSKEQEALLMRRAEEIDANAR